MSESNCSPGTGVGVNSEFSPQGYTFRIEVPPELPPPIRSTSRSSTPPSAFQGDTCGGNGGTAAVWPTAADIAGLQVLDPTHYNGTTTARYSGASSAGASVNPYCVGDVTTNANAGGTATFSTNLGTTFIVREPDDSPFDDFNNPIAQDNSGEDCVMQTRAYDLRAPTGSVSEITQLLTPGDGQFADSEAVFDSSDDFDISAGSTGVSFAESFRRWLSVCQIDNPIVGNYVLQIKTATTLGSPFTVDTTLSGKNRMAIRTGFASGTAVPTGGELQALRQRPAADLRQQGGGDLHVLPGQGGAVGRRPRPVGAHVRHGRPGVRARSRSCTTPTATVRRRPTPPRAGATSCVTSPPP